MKYYFKILNNEIDPGYAYSDDEILKIFPNLNLTTDIPDGYIQYIPAAVTNLKPYEKVNILGYEYVDDNTVTDKIEILQMSAEEKLQKQEKVKTEFYNKTKRYTWILNEEHCIMFPPFMPPQDEWSYRWDEPTQSYINMNITKKEYLKQNFNVNKNV